MREDSRSEIARMFCEVLEKQVFLFPEPIEAAILSRKQGCLVFGVDGYQVLLQATFCKVPGEKSDAVH